MEFPSFNHHHHHNRYVPPPSNSFPDDRPNFYPHHHLIPSVNLHPLPLSYPPLPPPPPPPPHPQPVPPPPPSYAPDFTFLDAPKPSYVDHNRFSPPPPRFSYQPNRFDYRNDPRSDPIRGPPELPHRNPVPEDHRRLMYSQNPQSENYYKPHGSERANSSRRFRDDTINDGYSSRDTSNIVSQEQQVFRGSSNDIDHYTSLRSVVNTDNSTGSSARISDDYVEKYDPRYMPMPENERNWSHHGEEEPKWVMKGKKNELGHNNGTSFVSGRESSRDYEQESSMFNRVREGREEFKQVQKKSVLLRIGKPNSTHRNRNYDQHTSKAHLVESNNRGKDKVKDKDRDHTGKDCSLYQDQRIEGVREHSPVDLDVSFKSNALVAKPVVIPSSPKSDSNHTQTRNGKLKKATEFGSPLSKFSERSTRSRSSSHGFDSPSSSEKALKQLNDKDSVSNGNKSNNSSLSGPALDQGNVNAGSKGPLSFRLKKKRKLIKTGFDSFNFQLEVKDSKRVNNGNIKSISIAPIPDATAVPTVEEAISREVDKSLQAVVLEKNDSEVKNLNLHCKVDKSQQANILEKIISEVENLNPHSEVDKSPQVVVLEKIGSEVENLNPHCKVDESPQAVVLEKYGSEVENLNPHCINSFDDDCTENKSFTEPNVSMTKDGLVKDSILSQQPKENEISLNLESVTHQNICTDVELSLGGTDDPATSGHDQTEIQKLSTESYTHVDVADVSNSLCNESVKMQETSSTANDMNFSDSSSVEIIAISSDRSDDQGSLEDASRKEDESQLFEVTSNQLSFNGSSESLEENIKESACAVIVTEDNTAPSDSHKEHSSDKAEIAEMVNSVSTSVQTLISDHREPITDSEDVLPPPSSIVSAFLNDSDGKPAESVPDILTRNFPSQKASCFSDSQTLTSKSTEKTSNSSIPEEDDNNIVKSVSEDVAELNAPEISIKTSQLEVVTNRVSSASHGSSVRTSVSNTNMQGSNLPLLKPTSVPAVPRGLSARSSPVFTNSRINKTTNSITKPRTWHRSPSDPVIPLPPKQVPTGQNSYIRSGNSLVRKGTPVSATASMSATASRSPVHQLNPSGSVEARNSAGPGNKVNNTYSRMGGPSGPVVRPKTPPLSSMTSSDCPANSRDLPSSPLELLPTSPVEGNDALQNVSEDQIGASSNEVVTGKKIQYVKRKSNQLVAASCSDQSFQELDKTQAAASSSDSYYKRRKNQLIRTSVGDESANADVVKPSKNNIRQQSGKGISKKYKHLRFPSVWKLNSQSLGKDDVSLHQKLRPQLFPWKRSRNLMNITASIPSNGYLSSISRKLLLSRKRETIYTRSKQGFSLRISNLLSVGGSSLKWSKSIERNSKKTNEEATLAVAAAEKRKREQHGTAETKRKNNTPRKRIFRIGSVRYKMDPSRRTLQRISDEEPSASVQSKEETRKSYVPKRLKIGHDEYVRIGNGNQLVRNPKRRTRVFASEKVRWSLHTARSRLAKKKKFCQFFTRFGKCNKDDGKCPYIHDSSKIAVCTKFLSGSCSNPNCKLTHKVIPERMQDCSYFLQGLCSNKHCPYRHVNVNPAASICEGFLKGYCADGNECRKKHSYACPAFEATGVCSEGGKCKLHHPKSQLKRKQRSSMEQQQKNSRGRYFGSYSGEEATEKYYLRNDDVDDDGADVDGDGHILCEEGNYGEYIGLDFGSEEGWEVASEQRTRMISEPLGLREDEFDDELTKPIGLMNSARGCGVGDS